MPIVPLFGHAALRQRLDASIARGALPGSLLLHGPRGVGKQRLALWLAQRLLCDAPGERPCDACQSCRYATELAHPDLHWFYPRPRPKDADLSIADVRADYAEATAERVQAGGLYATPSGSEGIFVVVTRALVQSAVLAPALGRRKVFVVGDADRMVPQEGSEQAANAFLKLLEEPPADTTLVLTSSEPGALLPTIRSRVVALRVPLLPESDVRAFLAHPRVSAALEAEELPASVEKRVSVAAGAPGTLFGGGARTEALTQARRLLDAARGGQRSEALRAAFAQGGSGARGAFADTLDALTVLLHERARELLDRDDATRALQAARAVDAVERAKALADRNINPQLVSAALVRELGGLLR